MKHFSKKVLCLLLLLVLPLSACIPQADSGKDKTPTPPPTQAKEPDKQGGEKTTEPQKELFNKEGLPIVNEPVTYEIAAQTLHNKDFKELEYFQKLEEKTGVIINWNMSSNDGWAEKKSLLFASQKLPDAFYGQHILTDIDIIKYAAQEFLIPLDEMIEPYTPNLHAVFEANPQYKQQIVTPDGHIYSLPTINELSPTTHDKFFINKVWLDKLGMEVPTTKEEFETVLKAFRDNDMNGNGDPNDEIPFSFRMSSSDPYNRQQGLQSVFGTFGQLDDIYHYIVKNGEVIYTPITEPYKEAIQWFHHLYSEGLLDKEAFTHDKNVYVSKIQDPGKIVGVWLGWSRSATSGPNKEDYVPLAPLKNVNGERIWRRVDSKVLSRGSFAITNKAQNPEILMRWIDESYDGETSLEICQGLLGHALEKTEDGKFKQMKLPEGVLLGTVIHDYSPGNNGTFALMQPTIDKLILNANLKERKELDEFYEPYQVAPEDMYPNVFFTEKEIERVGELNTDINSFVALKYAGWIVDGGIENEWESYLSTLKDMKVDEYIQIYKDAYDRYVKAK